MARIMMTGKPKLKNYLQRYDTDVRICQRQFERDGKPNEIMNRKMQNDMLDILEYVLEHREELMKLDLDV